MTSYLTGLATALKELTIVLTGLQLALAAGIPTAEYEIVPKRVEPAPIIIVEEEPPIWRALDLLAQCESGGRRDVKIVDVNGKYSYGTFQFQEATFHAFGEKYGLPHTDIMDRGEQAQIAKAMLENEPNGWKHWYHCSKKTGVDNMMF